MEIRQAFAKALRKARRVRGLTQKDFSTVSSRIYLGTLEHGHKNPTLDKIDAISQTIDIHFLSLLTLTSLYSGKTEDIDALLDRIKMEIDCVYRDEALES